MCCSKKGNLGESKRGHVYFLLVSFQAPSARLPSLNKPLGFH